MADKNIVTAGLDINVIGSSGTISSSDNESKELLKQILAQLKESNKEQLVSSRKQESGLSGSLSGSAALTSLLTRNPVIAALLAGAGATAVGSDYAMNSLREGLDDAGYSQDSEGISQMITDFWSAITKAFGIGIENAEKQIGSKIADMEFAGSLPSSSGIRTGASGGGTRVITAAESLQMQSFGEINTLSESQARITALSNLYSKEQLQSGQLLLDITGNGGFSNGN